ncbi:MAG: hypothetical protein QG565_315, partial [Campylobacterota bacterium]|nr:hypothetical protein [Campylobacterota bacterium]
NMFGKKLFHIFNHPSNEMIFFLFDRILENLDEDILSEEERRMFKAELLGAIQYPVYKSIQKYLNLNTESGLFIQKREILPRCDVLEKYFRIYSLLVL